MTLLFVASQLSENDLNGTAFTASTNQITHLTDIFQAATSINSQALLIIKPTGIILYTEYNHITNFQVSIDPSLFLIYNFFANSQETEVRLGIDITLVCDAFASVSSSGSSKRAKDPNVVDNDVTCYITYNGEGSPLTIEFQDGLMTEKLEFLTFYSDLEYPFDHIDEAEEHLIINHDDIEVELMLKSDVFFNLLQDLQQISTQEMFMHVSNESNLSNNESSKAYSGSSNFNQLSFISCGPIGFLKLIYPNEKTILEKLEVYDTKHMKPTKGSVLSCYSFENFSKILKSVKISSKCKLLKDTRGLLSVQLLCKNRRLANYSGALITFNILELTDQNAVDISQMFDAHSHEYMRADIESRDRLSLSAFREQNSVEIIESMNEGPRDHSPTSSASPPLHESNQGIDVPLFL